MAAAQAQSILPALADAIGLQILLFPFTQV